MDKHNLIILGTCFGDSCYLFSSTAQTWQKCKKYCENLHASLVKIETEEENNFLYSNTGGTFYWAGANDLETGMVIIQILANNRLKFLIPTKYRYL